MNIKVEIGKRFGMLTVIEIMPQEYKVISDDIYVKFLCDCGNEKITRFNLTDVRVINRNVAWT